MAYGRVNVGGSSGAIIKSVSTYKIKFSTTTTTLTVNSFDVENSIVDISTMPITKSSLRSFSPVSVMAQVLNSTTISLKRQSATVGVTNIEIECTVRIITFKNVKKIKSQYLKINCEDTPHWIYLPSDCDYGKCLVFHSQTDYTDSSGGVSGCSHLLEEFEDVYNNKTLKITPLYKENSSWYTECYYQIIVFK